MEKFLCTWYNYQHGDEVLIIEAQDYEEVRQLMLMYMDSKVPHQAPHLPSDISNIVKLQSIRTYTGAEIEVELSKKEEFIKSRGPYEIYVESTTSASDKLYDKELGFETPLLAWSYIKEHKIEGAYVA